MSACRFTDPREMAKLAIDESPAGSLPRRFLVSAPLWGMCAGVLLLVQGESLLRSRWQPGTLAMVHIFTLGVLGNAMFGSVLQFLPAAASVHVRGGTKAGHALHALFNVGSVLLVAGLLAGWHTGINVAGLLLPAAFLLVGAMTLPGILAGTGQRLLRSGIGLALVSAILTAMLGGCLVLLLDGRLQIPLALVVDVHASWGTLGWIVLLLASVARIVMPMFQGTTMVSGAALAAWTISLLLALCAGSLRALVYDDMSWLKLALVVHVAAFAGAALWLQWRSPRSRRGPLLRSWQLGLTVLLTAVPALILGTHDGLLAGALGFGVALPFLINGMSLEIVAFLGWIELHRRVGRGVQLPGVQRLLPEREKTLVLLAQVPMAVMLPAAVLYPQAWLARVAGLAMLASWFGVWRAMIRVRRRIDRYLKSMGEPR